MNDQPPRVQAAELARHIHDTVGPAQAWSLSYLGEDGRQYVIYPLDQSPGLTRQMELDSAHWLDCRGNCDRCRDVVAS